MIKKISGLILLIIMMICSVSLSVTYSKYLLTKNIIGEVNVPEVDYCIRNGITSLSECMLVMDNNNSYKTVEAAKLGISNKEFTLTRTAPIINYKEKITTIENSEGVIKTLYPFTLSLNYTFNSETGQFSVGDYVYEYMSDDYLNYYSCGTSHIVGTMCTRMYKILEYKAEGDYTIVTKVIQYDFEVTGFGEENGLYATEDDYGQSYFYRGNVQNNYVSYAGYIWRIVRQNGDGSIRMIYAGTDTSAQGEETTIGKSQFNYINNGYYSYQDPTHLGYMYGENFKSQTSSAANFNRFTGKEAYYFADGYEFDETTRKYKLTGNIVSKKWAYDYEEIIASYPYTCFGSATTSTCPYIIEAVRYKDDNTMKVKYHYYGSFDYDSTLTNTYSSTVKTYIDKWYESNILNKKDSNGKLYSTYLSDNIFCNDRSLSLGDGYTYSALSEYESYDRVAENYSPTLICSQFKDKFTVESTSGNGALTYPIALLTMDEVSLAGGVFNTVNQKYYLYNGLNYWTMSPNLYQYTRGIGRMAYVRDNGLLYNWYVSNKYYVRPVINLRSDIKITSGDGTADSPYVVSL